MTKTEKWISVYSKIYIIEGICGIIFWFPFQQPGTWLGRGHFDAQRHNSSPWNPCKESSLHDLFYSVDSLGSFKVYKGLIFMLIDALLGWFSPPLQWCLHSIWEHILEPGNFHRGPRVCRFSFQSKCTPCASLINRLSTVELQLSLWMISKSENVLRRTLSLSSFKRCSDWTRSEF